ncbi:MAG: efflux RND transporter periplasmic adaptor subunit [Treponema sp.]|jgi:RND family efflux transporter MFP subunit|nr:efflux RND transporter periplasmic adaptor subunit [Treponema sp.]
MKMVMMFFMFPVVLFVSCTKAQASSEGYIPRVNIAAAEEKILSEEVSGFGSLTFLTKVDVNASQEGVIRRLFYREGTTVPKGARIAVLENPQIELAVGRAENSFSQAAAALKLARSRLMEGEFRAEAEILSIAKAEAELAQAKKILEEQRRKAEDQEKLHAAGGLSDEAIRESRFSLFNAEEQLRLMKRDLEIRTVGLRDDDLKRAGLFPILGGFASEGERRSALIRLSTSTLRAEAEAAEAQLEAAKKELESVRIARSELTVYSPSTGVVGARYLEEGERAKKEDKILTLMDTGALYVIFPLRENDALRLRQGMSAKVKVDGTGDIYDGAVDLVSPQADTQSFTFSVRVLLPQTVVAADDKLKPGMFARVTVQIGSERSVLTVPESAVVNRKNDQSGNNQGIVFVVTQGKVFERTVQFGLLSGDDREICSGLKTGEMVVLKPETSLKEGSHVIPANNSIFGEL